MGEVYLQRWRSRILPPTLTLGVDPSISSSTVAYVYLDLTVSSHVFARSDLKKVLTDGVVAGSPHHWPG